MARLLVVLSIAWPLTLAGGWWSHAHAGPAWVTAAVYLGAGRVCHQRPERTFHTRGSAWPVCARCAGLYLAAPVGALLALRRRQAFSTRTKLWCVAAAVPTGVTFILEHAGLAAVSPEARALAALPLGLAAAYLVVGVTREPAAGHQVD